MTHTQIENEVRALGMKLVNFVPTAKCVNEFDCMVSEFYARDKISKATFMWAQHIIGARQ